MCRLDSSHILLNEKVSENSEGVLQQFALCVHSWCPGVPVSNQLSTTTRCYHSLPSAPDDDDSTGRRLMYYSRIKLLFSSGERKWGGGGERGTFSWKDEQSWLLLDPVLSLLKTMSVCQCAFVCVQHPEEAIAWKFLFGIYCEEKARTFSHPVIWRVAPRGGSRRNHSFHSNWQLDWWSV